MLGNFQIFRGLGRKSKIEQANLATKAMLIHVTRFIGLIRRNCKTGPIFTCNRVEQLHIWPDKCIDTPEEVTATFVMTTISCRGSLSCLIAFPRMTSERPLE
jgi:hypothetical protein